MRLLAESEQISRENQTKVAILEDEDEDEEDDKPQGIPMGNERHLDVSLQKQKEDIVGKLMNMNSNIRTFSSNVEERLQKAYRAGDYNKKFGYEGLNTRNMEESFETESARRNSTSTFEKLLHKDNKKLNRLQTQARNYMSTGSYNGDVSKMSSTSRISSANSHKSLPELGPSGRIGGLKSSRTGAMTGDVRNSSTGLGSASSNKNRVATGIHRSSTSSFK